MPAPTSWSCIASSTALCVALAAAARGFCSALQKWQVSGFMDMPSPVLERTVMGGGREAIVRTIVRTIVPALSCSSKLLKPTAYARTTTQSHSG